MTACMHCVSRSMRCSHPLAAAADAAYYAADEAALRKHGPRTRAYQAENLRSLIARHETATELPVNEFWLSTWRGDLAAMEAA